MEDKSELYVLGIVAIIAVIGIIAMITTSVNIQNANEDNIGYAVSVPLATNTCYDSDGGITFNTKGTVSGLASGTQYSYSDLCVNDTNGNPSKVLGEYYCVNNTPKSTATWCTIGCSNGACIQNTTPNTCKDSDGGMNLTVKGNASNGNTTIVDVCATPTVITEAICSGNTPVRSTTGCAPTFICSNGACIQNTTTGNTTTNTCTDSDRGIYPYISGTTSDGTTTKPDVCGTVGLTIIQASLYESYCDNGIIKQFQWLGCDFGCSNGKCNTPTYTPNCTDTDGGLNIYTAGITTSPYYLEENAPSPDYCLDKTILREYVCTPEGRVKEYGIACPYECRNGACTYNRTVIPKTNTCKDSDGGINLTVKGNASNGITTIVDVWGALPNYVEEATCNNNSAPIYSSYPNKCSSGFICSNGACIKG